MRYLSTRGNRETTISFGEAVLEGLADDGGLYVPEQWPHVTTDELTRWRQLSSYQDLAFAIFRLFIDEDEIDSATLMSLTKRAYSKFRHREITPVKPLTSTLFVLELFHGPTFAFKDVALQWLGILFEFLLLKRDKSSVVIGATSGDTGSAAIEGLRGKKKIDCMILYPKGRTSRIQELQMTTVEDANVHCVAVRGNFDDCQTLVKKAFTSSLRSSLHLGAVNSINIARIIAQMVYYFWASYRLLEMEREKNPHHPPGKVSFVVPTGNFGNILAGHYARRLGAPIDSLVIASNSNDILPRFRSTGEYNLTPVVSTISPSMDIQISSNFERFLYEVYGDDSSQIRVKFEHLQSQGGFTVEPCITSKTQEAFYGYSITEEDTKAAIHRLFQETGVVVDPHTAVGVVAAERFQESSGKGGIPVICLATAHWGKFEDSVREILKDYGDSIPRMPKELEMLSSKKQRLQEIGSDFNELSSLLTSRFLKGEST